MTQQTKISEEFREYKAHPTIELRNKLVEENLYIVDILIRKYLGKGVDYDDLYQVGAIALVSAVERFDPDKGFEFRSFATPTILGEIKKYFRDKEWSLKVPRRLKETAGKVQEAKERLTTQLGRAPDVEEISKETGFTHEQIMQAMESAKAYGTYSLDGKARLRMKKLKRMRWSAISALRIPVTNAWNSARLSTTCCRVSATLIVLSSENGFYITNPNRRSRKNSVFRR